MNTPVKTLRKASENTWVSDSGNFSIHHWTWCTLPWIARWTDIYGDKHEVLAETRKDLMNLLKPYGIKYRLARTAKESPDPYNDAV